ncbi:MAG TPA: FkbM family methyltransferase [Pyrinomonadaceae bacterium]|nr:FkbM family methyltransferase [Pyrinomonadaceae bacterium]
MSERVKSIIRRLRTGDGAAVAPERAYAASFVEVERAERIFYLEYLREGMTVFDVGANVGELTLLFSRFVGEAGTVHAFEPSGAGFERLSAVCRAASLRNVRLNRLALAEKEGDVRLHVYDDEYLSWTTRAARPLEDYGIDVKPRTTEDVPAATVDSYCERNGVAFIDLLKIDVEGAELQVLLGAERTLREKRVRCLTFEFGQTTFDMGNSPDQIEAFLQQVGYDLRNLIPEDPVFPGREGARTACYSMHVATPGSRKS